MAAQGRAGVRRSRLDSIAQTRLGDVRRAARGRRGLVLALLALGLRGCAADGWRPREFTPIHEVVGAPALLLYGGQGALPAMTSNALYAIGTSRNWEANVSQWISTWPGDTKLPEERESHTAVYCGGSMYVFAGMHFTNERSRYAQFNNVYRLDLKTMLWSEFVTSGDIPGPRDKHTAVVWERGDDDPLMIVYGGRDPSNYLNNQTYVLNLVNHTWRLQKTTTYSDNPVSPMYGHSAVMYENSMAVFGGTYMSGSPPAMDLEKRSGQGRAVCILQLEIWQWVCPWSQGTEVDHTRPRGSAFHSAVLASDGRTTQMIIYGGVRWNVTTNDFTVHNEVWMLDMKTMAWRAGPSVNRIERFFPWSGRYLHQAAIVGHEMWVVGGRNILRDDQYLLCDVVGVFESVGSGDSHCVFNDVLAFNLRTLKWRVVIEGGTDGVSEHRRNPPLHSFSMIHFTVPHPPGWSAKGRVWAMGNVATVLLLLIALSGTVMTSWWITRNEETVAMAVQPNGSMLGPSPVETDPQPLNPLTKEGAGLAFICLMLLCTAGIMQEWSEDTNHEYPYKVTSLVFVTEFTKMLVSLPLLAGQLRRSRGQQEVAAMLHFRPAEFLWYLVPAIFLSVQSLLSYSVVLELGAGLGQVMSQLRILFTGVVYDTMARWNFFGAGMRRLTETEWVGLAVLFLAEAIAAGDDLTSQSAIKTNGLVAASFMGAAAALGNLSLEAILKHSVDGSRGVEQSIWLQNLVLYCYTATLTLLLWVLDVSIEHAHKNLFHGWDGKTWVLLLFQVSSGQVIALVFKYLNSITYTVVQITSITVTGLLASALFHDKLSYSFLMGCCMVSVACYMMYRKSLDSSHRPVTGFTSPRDPAFATTSTPRGGRGHKLTTEVAELESPRQEEEHRPTTTEVPMGAVSRSSRADKGLRKEKDKGRRGGGGGGGLKAPPPPPPPPVPPPAFDPSELPGVGSTTIGLDDFYGDGDQDVEQLRSDSEQPDRLEVYEDDDDGSELGSFNV